MCAPGRPCRAAGHVQPTHAWRRCNNNTCMRHAHAHQEGDRQLLLWDPRMSYDLHVGVHLHITQRISISLDRTSEQKPPARVCRVSSGWRIVATEMQPSADERFSIVALSARRWWHAIARVPCPPILLGFAKTAIRSYVSRVSDGHNMVFYLYFLVKSNLKVDFYLKLVKCTYDTNVFKKHNN